jgi:methylenetetrahydrofolate--tRNA-(uracil-5-)-methyltransferase
MASTRSPSTTPRGSEPHVTVIGGGLAGSEAALQLAQAGVRLTLIEMRPTGSSPAHHTDLMGELVCSNSFKSTEPRTAKGTLKLELTRLGSRLLEIANQTQVPAGAALAVDRQAFARAVTDELERSPAVEIVRHEASEIPDGHVIVATGPLSSPALDPALQRLVGGTGLSFFDAAAPILDGESIDRSIAFAASRHDKGGGADYLNCPLSQLQYEALVTELMAAETVVRKDFETDELFQACQPAEEVARRGIDALRFGALKPIGLIDPRTGERPWAVVQLRPENTPGTAYNVVGFQTNLTFGEQERVLRMVPGLEEAVFLRHGVMHRNTFVDSPRHLDGSLAVRNQPSVRLAGQITGTEGYLEAIATGLLAALNTLADLRSLSPVVLPRTSALGALVSYATDPMTSPYQPMHVNWGLVPPLDPPLSGKRRRYEAYSARAMSDLEAFASTHPLLGRTPVDV